LSFSKFSTENTKNGHRGHREPVAQASACVVLNLV
jgi:hypothetical protein